MPHRMRPQPGPFRAKQSPTARDMRRGSPARPCPRPRPDNKAAEHRNGLRPPPAPNASFGGGFQCSAPSATRQSPPPPPQSPVSSGSTWDADGPGGSARGSRCRKAHAPRTRRTRAVGAAGADVLRAVTGRAPGTGAARCIAFVCGCRASGGMDYSIANVCRGGRVCEPPNLVDTTGDALPPPPNRQTPPDAMPKCPNRYRW